MPSEPAPSLAAHPLRTLLAFSFTNATCWMIALGTPMVLLASELGASPLAVGFAYSAFFLLLPVQIFATVGLPRFGYKKQMIFGWTARTFFLFGPLTLAFVAPAPGQNWAIAVLLGSIVGFAFFRSAGACAVMPWIYELVPESIRGRYFATDQSITGVAGVGTLLLCAALFALLPSFEAFAWQYACAILGSILAVWMLAVLPDAPKPQSTTVGAILRETPLWCTRPGDFRFYLVFMLVASVVISSFQPFIAYYLKVEQGLSNERILVYASLQFVGSIAGSFFVRSRLDQTGVKPFFRLALVGQITLMLFWILLVTGFEALTPFIPLAYMGFGMTITAWNAAHLKYLPRVCPEEKRALALSIHSSVVGVLSGIAPILWGLFLKEPAATGGGMHVTRFASYLILAAVLQVGLFAVVGRLTSKGRSLPPVMTFGGLVRSVRYVGSLIVPIRRPDPQTPPGKSEPAQN